MMQPFASLRGRLLLVIAIALIPAAALVAETVLDLRRLAQQRVEQDALYMARLTVHKHQQIISGSRQLLTALAEIPAVRNATQPACNELLARLLARNDGYTGLNVIAPNGDVKCSALPVPKAINVADRAYFQRALGTRSFSIGDYQIGRITGKPEVVAAEPTFDDSGKLQAVVIGALDLASLGNLAATASLPENSIVVLADSAGTIIARHPERADIIGKSLPQFEEIRDTLRQKSETVIEVTGLDGIARLAALTRLGETASGGVPYLQVAIPKAAVGDATALEQLIFRFLLVILLLFAAVSAGTDRYVIRGIRKLAASVARFGAGDLQSRAELARPPVEIADLARAFDDMAGNLQQALLDLQTQKSALDRHAIVSITDIAGVITYVNDKFCEISQYSRAELIGRTHSVINSGYHSREFFRNLWQTIGRGEVWHGETRNRSKDGNFYWVESTIVPFKDSSGHIYQYVSIRTDITMLMRNEQMLRKHEEELEDMVQARTGELQAALAEQKQMHAELQKTQLHLLESEKMASIGQLAAGVAHEINNPIGYVHSNLDSLRRDVRDMVTMLSAYEAAEPSLPEARRAEIRAACANLSLDQLKKDVISCIAESGEGIDRVREIVQTLRDFSHVDTTEWRWVDLHKGIDSTLRLAGNEIRHKAEVVKHYGNLPEVECLSSQINQVFLNLLVNAAHAIEQHGTITIRSGTQDDGVWVEIGDSGKGIPPEALSRIFDPFFTTKPVGAGTGLGLSLSYNIVNKHHGRITVESEIGKGTVFRVWLPVRQPPDNHY